MFNLYKTIKKIILCSVILLFVAQSANATKLPDDVWKYVKTNLPEAQQRFDSVITLKGGVMYIPLYPPVTEKVENISITYSYPSSQTLKQLPEVVLLNNGFSLLKVFKDKEGNYTLTQKDDLPIKVRLGLMPQDMLTPVGLKMPESLKLTLGDLLIPSKEDASLNLKDDEKEAQNKNPYSATVKNNEFIQTAEFKGKKTYINPKNSKFLEVYDTSGKKPLYELKLSSMPLKIITSDTSKVALVLFWSTNSLDIINLEDETVVAKLELDAAASDAVLNKKENIAYVTSQNANAIYFVDLNSMEIKRVVKLEQKPSLVAYSEIDDTIAFFDAFSSRIYCLTQSGQDYTVQPAGVVKNVSKVLADVANIYALSRTDNILYVFDKTTGKSVTSIDIDKKPTDALMYGTKIFILCSKEGYMDVYDIGEGKIVSRTQLSSDGFYSKMTLMPNKKDIVITGLNNKNYLIYNLENMKLVRKQEAYIDVANMIITDKSQAL